MEIISEERKESYSFWKNLILFALFFTATPIVLLTCLFTLFNFSTLNKVAQPQTETSSYGAKIFASLPSNIPSINGFADASDARPEIIKQYLADYKSPLGPYAHSIVIAADKYNLDFRLITAIAQKESNLCKIIPPDSFNCWGWGIYGDQTLHFLSYEDAIETVSKGLRENYLNKGLLTPEQIMTKYTPSSLGTWAYAVNQFIGEMQ